MAEVTLPDEIISEILSPALKVPDYKFSSLGPKSPFAKYSVSSSAALLVCKAWLRVATPLLYNVIVIRSKAQGRALEDALRTNPDLGRFIKKLRVEGGFGSSMHTILKCATNVTDIYLSLQIHSSDSSAGLAMGLPLINPQRLIIFDDRNNPLKNKAVLQLMATLTVCAPKWSNTHTVFLPYLIPPAVRQSFMLTMCSFKNIKIVSLPGFGTTPELLQIGAIPTLEAIEVRNKPTTGKVPVLQSTDPRLNSLVRWAAPHADLPRLKKLYTLQGSSSIAQLFARLFAHTPALRRLVGSGGGSRVVITYPALRALARSAGGTLQEISGNGVVFQGNPTSRAPAGVLRRFARLKSLTWQGSGSALAPKPKPFFHPGPRRQGQGAAEGGGVVDADADANAEDEDELEDADEDDDDDEVPVDALPALELLVIKSTEALPVLTQMNLPSLRRLTIHLHGDTDPGISGGSATPLLDFLRAHGAKIWTLRTDRPLVFRVPVLTRCPNASFYACGVDCEEEDSDSGTEERYEHMYLTTLVVTRLPCVETRGRATSRTDQAWAEVFPALQATVEASFPALREIRVLSCTWPSTEHAIAKSAWVQAAEQLLSRGIKLKDKNGVEWHPRLKSKSTRR